MASTTTQKKTTTTGAARSDRDALTVLKSDHRAVEKLFTSFEGAGPGRTRPSGAWSIR